MTNTVSETSNRTGAIDALLSETRRFPPSPEFASAAIARDESIYAEAERDPEAFWEARANEQVEWFKPWDRVLEWEAPFSKWFVGAEVNAAYNCVDRHAAGQRADKPAIIFEGEPGDVKTLSYRQLLEEVNLAAATLKRLGIRKGDTVAIYLPMIPEAAISMLACAQIGRASCRE